MSIEQIRSAENKKRAARARKAFTAYKATLRGVEYETKETILTDLLTDLLHFCDAEKLDLIDRLRVAAMHYTAESDAKTTQRDKAVDLSLGD